MTDLCYEEADQVCMMSGEPVLLSPSPLEAFIVLGHEDSLKFKRTLD